MDTKVAKKAVWQHSKSLVSNGGLNVAGDDGGDVKQRPSTLEAQAVLKRGRGLEGCRGSA